MIKFVSHLMLGMSSAFTVTVSPLYRYPYRNSAEALRGDWLKIGKDVERAAEEMSHHDAT